MPDSRDRTMPQESKVFVTPVGVLNYHRQYERYIFFYFVIMCFWLWLAAYTFSHYKNTAFAAHFSPPQNLALGFVCYLFFAAMIALTPYWYRLTLHSFTGTKQREEHIWQMLEEADSYGAYEALYDLFRQNGEFPPSFKQTLALMGIFWILMFELLILYGWIENFILVWQPDWLINGAQWVIDNTGVIGDKPSTLFKWEPKGKVENWSEKVQEMLKEPYGRTLGAVHLWILFSYPLLIACFGKVLWQMLDWLGLERMNPRNIRSAGKFLWLSFLSPFMLALLYAPTMYIFFLEEGALIKLAILSKRDISLWFSTLALYLGHIIFCICSIKFFGGWFQFWRRVWRRNRRRRYAKKHT